MNDGDDESEVVTERWEGIATVVGIAALASLASVMVLNGYECRSLYPVVAVVAGLAGFSVSQYRRVR